MLNVQRSSLPSAVTYHVSCPAHRMQKWLRESLVYLRAQPRDMHIDDIGLGVEMIVPDVFQQQGPGHDLAGVLHEVFEQPEFARLERDLPAAANDPMRQPVELEIG